MPGEPLPWVMLYCARGTQVAVTRELAVSPGGGVASFQLWGPTTVGAICRLVHLTGSFAWVVF